MFLGRVRVTKLSVGVAESFESLVAGLGPLREVAQTDLKTSLIPAAWLISGEARTRSKLLEKTHDGLACVMYWECGATKFKWHYSKDEFLIILSGDAFISDGGGGERHFGPSDVVFFPAGSDATWRVPDHVRKIAILRNSVHQPVAFMLKAWIKMVEMAGLSGNGGL